MKAYVKLLLAMVMVTGVVLAVVSLPSQSIRAAGPWYVKPGGNDGNDCLSSSTPCATINGAIAKASSGDVIKVATGVYTSSIGSEVVLIDKSVTLSGGWQSGFITQTGTSIIDGQGVRRGMTVNNSVTVSVQRFIVQNGFSGQPGGGIFNDSGILTLNNSVVSNNKIDGGFSSNVSGGGIANLGTLTLNNSIVSNNTADGGGGGVYNYGILTLNNSTISNNNPGEGGGGIYNNGTLTLNNSTVSGNKGGGIYTANSFGGLVTLNSSTIANNTAENGGGIANSRGTVTLRNSILARNVAGDSSDCSGTIDSSGYNLVGTTSGCIFNAGTGDLTNIDPKLGPLGGAPGYHPLSLGSPAIDAGNPAGCFGSTGLLTTDQRGAARVGRCDIGAYEYTTPGLAASISAIGGTPQRTTPYSAFETPLQAAALDGIGSPVAGVTVTFSAPTSGASGTFAGGVLTTTSVTDQRGIAIAAMFTANGVHGSYVVTATASGVVTPATLSLTNFGWYVAANGNDANTCQTPAAVCATINGVLGKGGFLAGDTVLVAVGAYSGSGDEVVLLDKRVRLLGGWNGTFTAQSGMSTIDGQGVRRGIAVNRGVAASLERFVVQNGTYGVVNNGNLTLNSSIVTGNAGNGIYSNDTLTLNNSAVTRNSTIPTGGNGGGIYSAGTLTLNNSTVSGNTTDYDGGGIYSGYIVTLNNSTVNGNTADRGGGIFIGIGTINLNNSTVSGNTASQGGGVYGREFFGIFTLTLNNTTVTGNTASLGGGLDVSGGTTTIRNSVIAGNRASIGPDCNGTLSSSGYNLIGNTSGCTLAAGTGDLLDVNAGVIVLASQAALRPGSPAIDAGNPAGCMDNLGNPITTDQRGVMRPLDGNGDGNAICDIGAYEFDPNNPIKQVFLSVANRNFCPDFFDGFDNPASGWPVGEDDLVRTEYLGGEYRVLSKNGNYIYLFRSPSCDRENYVVEADARWADASGDGYGLVFGIAGNFSQYYLFYISADFGDFALIRRDLGGFYFIVPFTPSPAINGGAVPNHLKVTRNGSQITLEVNGTVLGTWFDSSIVGSTGAGVFSNPYTDPPISDARFDNFSMASLPGGSAAVQQIISATAGSNGSEAVQRRIDGGLRRGDAERGGR